MKALTLHQPWASLIAIGAKKIETRTWATKYRGPLAIHAGARPVPRYEHRHIDSSLPPTIDHAAMGSCWEWFEHPDDPWHGGLYRWCGPLSAVVATANLVDCLPTTKIHTSMRLDWRQPKAEWHTWADGSISIDQWENALGDFTPGRFAWLLDNVKALDEPVPAKGRQGLWEWADSVKASA